MKIVIEKGMSGAWFATAEGCGIPGNELTKDTSKYRGLLVVGASVDEVINRISDCAKDLQEAVRKKHENSTD